MSVTSTLAAKVAAVNEANLFARTLYEPLEAAFRLFIGEQIITESGVIIQRLEYLLPVSYILNPYGRNINTTRRITDFSVAFVVEAFKHVPGDGSGVTVFHQTALNIGHLDGGILKALYALPELRSDYTVEEIEASRVAYNAALKTTNDLYQDLRLFETDVLPF
jgi:hypothetical protein